ncbi:ECF transporter S component [Granulicoccus phenolivorans]|uniref:ECF transporter S component n=1 Tax=Granulicoccus phenolivorans TaxID=266854 RepID=UPI0003F5077A|nr:ECF transporter S component [Granulicoccus phenolivorans]
MTATSSNSANLGEDQTRPAGTGRLRWRVVDIVVAAVLGVACGVIFVGWNTIGYAWFAAMDAVTPGLGGLAAGVWFLAGPLGALIIRKPGAALLVELIAAFVSMAMGNQWGWTTMYSGFAQGLGAEIVFAALRYRRFTLPVAVLAGVGAGLGAFVNEFILGNWAKSPAFNAIYAGCTMLSGAVLAGLLGWLLMRTLARTGALDRFAAGREARPSV